MINNVCDVLFELKRMNINSSENNKIKLLEKINKNFDKEELKNMLNNANMLVSLLSDRVNNIKDEMPVVTIAYISMDKKGNSKFVSFSVSNTILLKDALGNIEYKSTGLIKDMVINKTFHYKKSDKQSIKTINDFKTNIIELYNIDNIAEFENDFNDIMINGIEVQ